jgi:hypothetical protein
VLAQLGDRLVALGIRDTLGGRIHLPTVSLL